MLYSKGWSQFSCTFLADKGTCGLSAEDYKKLKDSTGLSDDDLESRSGRFKAFYVQALRHIQPNKNGCVRLPFAYLGSQGTFQALSKLIIYEAA
jgi:hypothetical protein